MENCGNCYRGLVQGEVCQECNGTMFLLEVKPKVQKKSVVEKVKKVLKKK